MNVWLFALAAVTTVNPARLLTALPPSAPSWRRRVRVAAAAGLLTWVALVPVAALADPVLDGFRTSAATARMAAGVLLVVTGAVTFALPPPRPEPASRFPALVPLAFPLLLTPGLAVLTLSASVDRSAPGALAMVGAALATFPLLGAVLDPTAGPARDRVAQGLGRFLAGLGVLAGLGLLMDGIFDI